MAGLGGLESGIVASRSVRFRVEGLGTDYEPWLLKSLATGAIGSMCTKVRFRQWIYPSVSSFEAFTACFLWRYDAENTATALLTEAVGFDAVLVKPKFMYFQTRKRL